MKEELLIPLVGAVVVAIIAGSISLAVTILSKDQKTSEFRQLWIDSLRNDVSKLAGVMYMILSFSSFVKKKGADHAYEFAVSSKEDFVEVNNLITRIRLRLNVKEHTHLLKLLQEIDDTVEYSKEKGELQIKGVIDETQKILKTEWERVKRGERSFQILKWSSAATLIAGLFCTAWYFYL